MSIANKAYLAAALGILLAGGAARAADTYKLDPVHSMVIFKIRHMGVSDNYGRFDAPGGTFVVDADPANMSFTLQVDADKIDTANAKRDSDLKGPDFFNVKEFPTIDFKSTAVKKTGDDTFEVSGDLSLHGVTKSITVTLQKIGEADVMGAHRCGFGTTVQLKRSDYGMDKMLKGIGDDVTLLFNLEGVPAVITPIDIVLGVLLPALVAGMLLILAWRPWRRGMALRPWAAPLAVGGAFIAGYVALLHLPSWPPADAVGWILFAAPLLALAGVVDARVRLPAIVRWAAGWAICAGLLWLLSRPLIQNQWSRGQATAWIGALSLAMVTVWRLTEALVHRDGGESIILLCAMSAAAALVLMLSDSQTLGQTAGMLTAAIWAAAALALWARRPALLGGMAAVFAPILLALIVCTLSDFYAGLTRTNAVLLVSPALLVWGARLPAVAGCRWRRLAAALLLTLVPLLAAAALAATAFAKASAAESAY